MSDTSSHPVGEAKLPELRFDPAGFSLRVRLEMARANLSIREAAGEMEVDKATLHRVCKHSRPPDVENYLRISEWLKSRGVSHV